MESQVAKSLELKYWPVALLWSDEKPEGSMQFEPGRKVRPWLYTVATNQAIDAQRRNKRHRMVSLDRCRSQGDDEDSGPLMNLLDSEERDPTEQFEAAEEGGFAAAADQRGFDYKDVIARIIEDMHSHAVKP